jgi:hypothetical protein
MQLTSARGVDPKAVMDTRSAMASGVAGALRGLSEAYGNQRDSFHELLFHLLYERSVRIGEMGSGSEG